jgi:hypothetical protein
MLNEQLQKCLRIGNNEVYYVTSSLKDQEKLLHAVDMLV